MSRRFLLIIVFTAMVMIQESCVPDGKGKLSYVCRYSNSPDSAWTTWNSKMLGQVSLVQATDTCNAVKSRGSYDTCMLQELAP